MDKELFERLVKEAGIESFYGMNGWDWHIRQFAHLVAEECAKEVLMLRSLIPNNGEMHSLQREALNDAAHFIGAKFPPPEVTG